MRLDNQTPFNLQAIPLPGVDGYLLTVMVKATFGFDGNPRPEQIPIAFGDDYDDEAQGGGIRYETDIVPFKPRTDIVLAGRAHAPEGRPVTELKVGLKVGPVEKTLKVFGQRLWNHAGILSRRYSVTVPQPFVTQVLRYTESFGGMDETTGEYCPYNLSGKGFYSKSTKANLAGKPLPLIEDPRHLIKTHQDHPLPVGFGFYNRAWQPRAGFAGTYDNAWRRERSPRPPKDFSYLFYNGAHPDLQVKDYLQGGEPVELIHLSPEGRIQLSLPAIRLRCMVRRSQKTKEEKLPMNLDTVFIQPDEGLFCLVWRGATPLAGMSGTEIAQVTVGILK